METHKKNKEQLLIRRLFALALSVAASWAQAEVPSTPQKHTLSTANGQSFDIYLFEPNAQQRGDSAVITVHGGGWRWGKAAWTFNRARAFANAGMLAVAVDYRLASDTLTPVDALQDVCAALQWVRGHAEDYAVDPNKVAAYGVSAGGHLSSLAATNGCGNQQGSLQNGGPDLLLLWSPALDMERDNWFQKLLLGQHSARDNSPLAQVTDSMPPAAIVQGELDTLTPTTGASGFCEKIEANGGICELNIYPGVGHLLTRNLEEQERNFDPHPEYVASGNQALMAFLSQQGFTQPLQAEE